LFKTHNHYPYNVLEHANHNVIIGVNYKHKRKRYCVHQNVLINDVNDNQCCFSGSHWSIVLLEEYSAKVNLYSIVECGFYPDQVIVSSNLSNLTW